MSFSVFRGCRRRNKPGTCEIAPAEEVLARRTCRVFPEICSPKMIADILREDSVCIPSGREKYSSTVAGILENEKYAGDLLMQKYCVKECLTHKCVKNRG